jgi:NADH:ubiquinone oxidoreductase subunit 6 (subunit J)
MARSSTALKETAGCVFVAATFLSVIWAIVYLGGVMVGTMYSLGLTRDQIIQALLVAFGPLTIVLGVRFVFAAVGRIRPPPKSN